MKTTIEQVLAHHRDEFITPHWLDNIVDEACDALGPTADRDRVRRCLREILKLKVEK